MELVEQDVPPDLFQLVVRVREPTGHHGRGRPQLCLSQQVLAAAVALFDLDLARDRAPVQLEVELAGPDRRVRVLGQSGGEELGRGFDRDLRRPVEVRQATGSFHHLPGRPRPRRRSQRALANGCRNRLGIIVRRVRQLRGQELGVVACLREENG